MIICRQGHAPNNSVIKQIFIIGILQWHLDGKELLC
jgi:hypothetical protein